ncbi:MAG: hypothetical protein R3C18_16225 [Planctomycetaceae bacterium]
MSQFNDYDDEPEYWVDGQYLVVQNREELPRRCIHTNVKVGAAEMETKTLYYVPMIAQMILPVILIPLMRKPVEVTYGISKEVRSRKFTWNVVFGIMLALAVVLIVLGAALEAPAIIIGFPILLFTGLIGLVVTNRSIGVYNCKKGINGQNEFWLSGIHKDFLNSVEDELDEYE